MSAQADSAGGAAWLKKARQTIRELQDRDDRRPTLSEDVLATAAERLQAGMRAARRAAGPDPPCATAHAATIPESEDRLVRSARSTSPPAFQFYPADWLSSTSIALMSAAEERGYLRLLCHAWADENCSLPDDPPKLIKLALLRTASQLEVVLRQFAPHPELPGRLINARLFEIRQKTDDFRAERAAAGRAGGRKAQAQRREEIEKPSLSKASSSASHLLQANGEAKSSSSSSSSGAPSEPCNTPPLASRETPRADRTRSVEGLPPEELVDVYNARRGGLAAALETSAQRRARLLAFSRKHPRLTAEEFGAFVEALGRDPWACGTKPGGRTAPITIDVLVRGDFFERQREMLASSPRRLPALPNRASSRPQKWEEFDRLSMTAGDEPSTSGAGVGEKSG